MSDMHCYEDNNCKITVSDKGFEIRRGSKVSFMDWKTWDSWNYKYESFDDWYETILITDHIVLYREAFEAAREIKSE